MNAKIHKIPNCPHCESRLIKWRVPVEATWNEEFFYICFSNNCSYYKDGWDWMMDQYGQKASYRYVFNPETGGSTRIPVWSDDATRNMIIGDEEGGGH